MNYRTIAFMFIILKRYSIPCPENEDDLFAQLYQDTTAADLAALEWQPFRDQTHYDTVWIGNVYRDNREFQLRMNKAGLLKNKVSRFSIRGRIVHGFVSKIIGFEIGLGWDVLTEFLIYFIIFISLATQLIGNTGVILLAVALMALLVALVFDDFFGAEERIETYFKKSVESPG